MSKGIPASTRRPQNFLFAAVAAFIFGSADVSYAQAPTLVQALGRAVVHIRVDTPRGREPHGTGFLIQEVVVHPSSRSFGGIYLATNRHVLLAPGNLFVLVPFKDDDGRVRTVELNLTNQFNLSETKVVLPADSSVDLALLPLPLDDHILSEVGRIPSHAIHDEPIDSLVASQVFFLGFPVGLVDIKRPRALYRFGVVSGVKADGKLLIDAQNFGGSSGSPIFLFPTQLGASGISMSAGINLIGIMSAFEPSDLRGRSVPTQAKSPVVPVENSGIARAEWARELRLLIDKAEKEGLFQLANKQLQAKKVPLTSLYSDAP